VKRYVNGTLQNIAGVIDIAAGNWHNAALLEDGTVFVWGADDMGQLGNADGANADRPVAGAVSYNGVILTGIVAIASGGNHMLALHSSGEVYAWGSNSHGQLGDGNSGTNRYQAVKVITSSGVPLTGVTEIAGGARHSIALNNDQVYTWGDNTYGQLGKGTVGGAVAVNPEPRNLFTDTAPVADAKSLTINEDTPGAVTLSGSDPEGKPLTYGIVTAPAASKGSLSGTAPNLTFTPAPNYHGTASFTYKVNDGRYDSLPATVSITINPINDPPVVNAGPDFTSSNLGPVTLNGAVTDIDTATASLMITWSKISGPGNVIFNPANSAATQASFDAPGTYLLQLQASDGAAVVNDAVSIVVQAPVSIPAAPSNLRATRLESGKVRYEWDDNSNNEDGFIMEEKNEQGVWVEIRRTGPGINWVEVTE
jgi:hypothetical protein